ncbi:MAG: hypothetical protein IJQ83_02105 [Bacteroidales bacterium]|nr:hypothetical protein [Bacteroidales bacterium]
MQKIIKLKQFVLLLGLILPTIWCGANNSYSIDGHSNILIKEGNVQSSPNGFTIQATIDEYAIKRFADNQGHNHYIPEWMGNDTLTIDYIKVCQLDWDCGTDETITCQNDLTTFCIHPSVKHSISISSTNETITVNNTDKITFRVADSFEITGLFQASNGCEFTVIRQDCPE